MRLLAVIEAASVTGPAKNLIEFATLARPLGVGVSVAAIVRGSPNNAFAEAVRNAGIRVETVPERRVFDTSVIPALRRIALSAAPDLIQTHAVKSHFLARMAGLPKIAPWIAFHHGYTRPARRVLVYNQLDRWSLRAASRVITVSIPFRDELVRRGARGELIEIVHNAISPDWGSSVDANPELRHHLGIPPQSRIVLSVGRLSKEKDHRTLLKAMHALPVSLDAHLLIVGDGPERGPIEQEVRELGLTKRVTLAGHQPSVAPYYAIASMSVISSRSEGSPNSLLEALVSGVPVVATRVGGIPEHVTHGESALLVPPRNAAAMSFAIAEVLAPDRALAARLIQQGRTLILERFSPEIRARKLIEIYKKIMRETSSP
jgi:glycosyltransferase involved in cell wall biosynthesis